MTAKQRKTLIRIIVAGVLFAGALVCEHTVAADAFAAHWWLGLAVYAVPYIIVGWDVVASAVGKIIHGQMFDETLLMTIATAGAFGAGEFAEACAVMLFYQVGELFQSIAVGRSRASIAALMEIVPEVAHIEGEGGAVEDADPDDVEPGSVIVIRPGERIPLDGVVLAGESMVDTSALTGESVPRRACPGGEVISGCVNGAGVLRVRTTKAFEDSTVSRILELVENASARKAHVENFITRFARVYTPVVTIAAVLLAVVPPLAFGAPWMEWLQRACVFLVVSCPCALVISVPLAFFAGIGRASRSGVLVKGGNYLEAVARMDTLVLDKTGTLTKGEFAVQQVVVAKAAKVSEQDLLGLAALAESHSTHPIAASIRATAEAAGCAPADPARLTAVEEIAGQGVVATIAGAQVLVGSAKLLAAHGVTAPVPATTSGTIVHVAADGEYAGYLVIADAVKPGAAAALAAIREAGVSRIVMLTGDTAAVADEVGAALGVDRVCAELLPQDKVAAVEDLLADQTAAAVASSNRHPATLGFVGDGINDAPVLSRADVGFAMGSLGSDAAIEAADIVIMDDDLAKIPLIIRIARRTLGTARANIAFALAVKFAVLILGALGIADMWAAVFADVGVAVLCILNSMRIFRAN